MRAAAYRGNRVSCLMCTYVLALSLFMFLQHFCLILSRFIVRNLTLPLFKQDVFVRNSHFSPARSISVVKNNLRVHLLTLKRLMLHFTNPLVNIPLRFYVVSLTSCNFNTTFKSRNP